MRCAFVTVVQTCALTISNVSNISSLFLFVDNDVIRSAIEGSKQRIPLVIRSSPTDEFQPVHGRNLPARAVHPALPAVSETGRRGFPMDNAAQGPDTP